MGIDPYGGQGAKNREQNGRARRPSPTWKDGKSSVGDDAHIVPKQILSPVKDKAESAPTADSRRYTVKDGGGKPNRRNMAFYWQL